MAALTQDRNTPRAEGDVEEYPVLAATLCYAGGLAVLDADGYARPGAAATGLLAVGRFEEQVDNSAGASGDKRVKVRRGVFRWNNSADADLITIAEIGDNCYIADDQTVAKVATGRSAAGRIEQVDELGVWVRTGSALLSAPGGALLAANNLSDLGNVGTSRNNLAVNEGMGTPTFVIGNETTGVRTVSIQLKTVAGADLAVRGAVQAYLSADANGDALSALDLASVAAGADGVLIPGSADTGFTLVSEADGDIDVTIDSNANGTLYLVLIMPNGRLAASGAITFAAAE